MVASSCDISISFLKGRGGAGGDNVIFGGDTKVILGVDYHMFSGCTGG